MTSQCSDWWFYNAVLLHAIRCNIFITLYNNNQLFFSPQACTLTPIFLRVVIGFLAVDSFAFTWPDSFSCPDHQRCVGPTHRQQCRVVIWPPNIRDIGTVAYILFKLGELTLKEIKTGNSSLVSIMQPCIFSTYVYTTSRRLYFTLQGKLNSLMKPKSSPVASNFLSLVSEEALTKLSVGQIPSQVEPRTDVHVAHSTFSNYTHTHTHCSLASIWLNNPDIWAYIHIFFCTSAMEMFCLRPRGASKNNCSLAPVFTCSNLPAVSKKKISFVKFCAKLFLY